MSPICPIDTGVKLVAFTEDVTAQAFWECPVHKGRYVSHGIMGLIPVPRAIIATPRPEEESNSTNVKAIIGYYYDKNDNSVWLKLDGEESYFKHTTSGTGTGDLTYIELNVSGASPGQNNFTDANWNVSKARVDHVEISVATGTVTDYDLAIYEKDTFLEADKRYEVHGLSSGEVWEDSLDWNYVDDDSTNEVHVLITENSGSGTYNINIRGVKLV